MTEEQAKIEAKKIFKEWGKKQDEIMEKAKANGTWRKGCLDGNQDLLKELKKEMENKLEVLKSLVDKD